MELKPFTRLRAKIVETVAALFSVPATVHHNQFFEVKENDVELYVSDCMLIAEKIFDMDEIERDKFYTWLHPHLMENIDEPFNLHDGAFHTVCAWHGILLGDDPKLPALLNKLNEADLDLKTW